MKKYNINDAELRDPKREWYDAEHVEAVIQPLQERCEALSERVKAATAIVVEQRKYINELENKLKDAGIKV